MSSIKILQSIRDIVPNKNKNFEKIYIRRKMQIIEKSINEADIIPIKKKWVLRN